MSEPGHRAGSFRELIVWRKSIALVKRIYQLTQSFPGEERFGLTTQMRRAFVSIPSNIAEGQARLSTKEFIRFISNAEGSVAELETQLEIAKELQFCNDEDTVDIMLEINEVRKMLNSLRRKLSQKKTSND